MQPSELEIQREVEVLRDLRRRSTTPGALLIDPDLPSGSSGSNSPASTTWSGGDGDSSSTSHDDDMSADSHNGGAADDSPANDPFHLFWVPANVHPEIAPAEFRAFLKEHARSPPPPGEANLNRSGSLSSLSTGSLSRKKSMLSRQYRPSANDGVGEGAEEEIVPVKRTPSLYRQGPQLTISDLQRLEELADEASQSDDPTRLRTMLRRSLSMNVSASAMDRMDSIPDVGDEADAPILVPPSQQSLRRANRTKIRKAHLAGDGGGHRFAATRRVHGGRSSTGSITEKRSSSDRSSSEHGDETLARRRTFDKEPLTQRPESYSEETSIYDAYAGEDDDPPVEEARPAVVVTTAPPAELSPIVEPIFDDFETPTLQTPVLHQPQPHRMLSVGQGTEEQSSSRTPSPSDASGPLSISPSHSPEPSAVSPPPHAPHPSQSPPPHQRKDKDKKGLFKWGSDKGGKKAGSKPETQQRTEKEKEKDSGFFGSLFGGKKHKDNEAGSSGNGMLGGREAAVALLGGSKSAKAYNAPPSPTPSTPGVDNWSRYPIHVERAIYRLSHIKLANPRRPLYEQVLISNLMFWYLGVINKAQNPAPAQAVNGQAAPAGAPGNAAGAGANGGAHSHAAQQQQQEEQERLEKERQERERQEREQKEQEQNRKRDVSPKRGPLTKPARGDGRRGAEMPVKGPQYDKQHRAMEDEYMFNSPPPNARGGSPQQPQEGGTDYYQQAYQQNLPPGAMPPPQQQHSPHRRSQSPPQHHQAHGSHDNGNHRPQRSVSATAVAAAPSPQPNGKIRKGHSAYAGKPSQQNGRPTPQREPSEDEDMPLAMWQQQQRRR